MAATHQHHEMSRGVRVCVCVYTVVNVLVSHAQTWETCEHNDRLTLGFGSCGTSLWTCAVCIQYCPPLHHPGSLLSHRHTVGSCWPLHVFRRVCKLQLPTANFKFSGRVRSWCPNKCLAIAQSSLLSLNRVFSLLLFDEPLIEHQRRAQQRAHNDLATHADAESD